MRGAESGDAVDDEEGLGVFGFEEFGDAFDVVADAGGGLGGLDEDGAGFELEGGFDFVEGEGLAVEFFHDVAWQPKDLTREAQRSPNLPAVSTSTRSPGDVRLETEASMAPVPEAERMMTSFLVPTKSLS